MTDPDELPPCDEDFLDRIVDGGLTPAELRSAIDRLDREPDGWKRCALAFLEAQCWREVFRASAEPSTVADSTRFRSISSTTGHRRRSPSHWLRGLVAACIAAASFTMGWLAHSEGPMQPAADPASQETRAIATRYESPVPEPPSGTPGAVDPARSADLLVQQSREDRFPPELNELVTPVGRLRISTPSASAEVPILAGPGITEEWVREQPPPVSEQGQAYWGRQGYQVDQHRRLITTTLGDGRHVTVPIDQVEFRYTGNRPL
jgi:hypothetical protein